MRHEKPKTHAGLWIDHRETIIVHLSETGEEITRIQSDVERQPRRSDDGSSGPTKAQEGQADDSRQREFTGHLARYYDEVIAALRDADSILIFGPGEAKGELKKRFEKHKGDTRPLTVETADRMTEPQVVAQVRHHFHVDAPRRIM